MEQHYQFDVVELLSPVAMGVPGKRTFFLIIGQKEKWVRIWLEKYLLESLAMAIDQFLLNLSREHLNLERGSLSQSDALPKGFPSAELEVEEIGIGLDRRMATLVFNVHGVGPKAAEHAELQCLVNRTQLEKLAEQARKVVAAGRPICTICGNPIDPSGHICPGGN